ncbi:MAG: DUF5676 family membrane protein [Nanoarchaeota archaeon]
MAGKLSAKRTALSLALASGIFSLVCALLIALAPQFTMNLFGAIFHGIDISQIIKPITFISALLGTVEVAVIGLIGGWLYAVIYNRISD